MACGEGSASSSLPRGGLKRPHGQSPYGLYAAPPSRRLREDFVDQQFGALALLCALLVMARDHLADESEGEELHPDDEEEDPEHQQWSLPDRVAERLEDGQVDQDCGPDGAEHEAEPTEQMQWPVAVAADERDGEEI